VTADDNKRATQRFIDHAWNGGQYEQARDHLAPDFVNHTPVGEETRDDFLARIKMFREALIMRMSMQLGVPPKIVVASRDRRRPK
jgi:hypothetical protein